MALFAMADPQPVGGAAGQLVIGQINDLVGHADRRRCIAGDEMIAAADPQHLVRFARFALNYA